MIAWLERGRADPTIDLMGRTLPIELKRHAQAKRLTLRLAPDGSAVRVTLPRWCPAADALNFAEARREWLEAQLHKVPMAGDPVSRGSVRYRAQDIRIGWEESRPRRAVLEADALCIGGPRDTLAPRLQRWLENEALRLMQTDLVAACDVAGVAVPTLRITRARRRWGSCSSSGIVRINWRLVMAPDFVRRSVVAHETAHLVHFDHSPAFHSLLAEIYGASPNDADAWLREHGRGLYADFG